MPILALNLTNIDPIPVRLDVVYGLCYTVIWRYERRGFGVRETKDQQNLQNIKLKCMVNLA